MAEPHRLSHGPWGLAETDAATAPGVDGSWMDRAIDIAWLGAGRTHPNPLVGAVVVKGDTIVGEGYHEACGLEHAEVAALARAGGDARGATLYATLEPCAHFGRTPPCTERILESGVSRVVVSTIDPDPRVNGAGIDALRQGGIEVTAGPRAERAMLLNIPYFKRTLGLGAAVTIKAACSLDGRIATRRGSRDTISGGQARQFVHRLRAVHEAVLVGSETLLVDRPRLDCRLIDGARVPTPVVMDARLRFPTDCPWIGQRRPFIVLTSRDHDGERRSRIAAGGGRVRAVEKKGGRLDPPSALGGLAREGVTSVLVEGGAGVFSSFMEGNMWDALHVFVSPLLFGAKGVGLSPRAIDRARLGAVPVASAVFGADVLVSYLSGKTRDVLMEKLVPR
ncbi:MAG: bifunctional diaminohydroxyphosphoribosylaminopyrimidine deaminase/5-amino-6-(5-phosphoribosylamino)uracil reductase RibD [Candidatus Krumholzibacteriia bacterium]